MVLLKPQIQKQVKTQTANGFFTSSVVVPPYSYFQLPIAFTLSFLKCYFNCIFDHANRNTRPSSQSNGSP